MPQAGYTSKIKVSTDESTWVDLPATSPSLSFGADVLDVTELATNTGYKQKITGLLDWSMTTDVIYDSSNSAISMLKTAMLSRGELFIQFLPSGVIADGLQGKVVVETMDMSGAVEDKVTQSVTLQGITTLADAS